ncbi:MAG: VWA domain-containing protein [Capsulimonadaceae bacterium]
MTGRDAARRVLRDRRVLGICLAASVLVHLIILASTAWWLPDRTAVRTAYPAWRPIRVVLLSPTDRPKAVRSMIRTAPRRPLVRTGFGGARAARSEAPGRRAHVAPAAVAHTAVAPHVAHAPVRVATAPPKQVTPRPLRPAVAQPAPVPSTVSTPPPPAPAPPSILPAPAAPALPESTVPAAPPSASPGPASETSGSADNGGQTGGGGSGAGGGRLPFAVGYGSGSGPRHIVYVLDISLSMATRIERARQELLDSLSSLGPGDSFDIIAFCERDQPFDASLVPVSTDTEAQAKTFLGCLELGSGTDLQSALQHAVSIPGTNCVVVITDGVPTAGETDFGKIARNVRRHNRQHVRIYAVGLVGKNLDGTDDSFEAAYLLRKLASDSGGSCKLVSVGIVSPD